MMEKDTNSAPSDRCTNSPPVRQSSVTSSSSSITLHAAAPRDPNRRPECFQSTFVECLFVLITTFAVAQNNVVSGSIRTQTASVSRDLHMNEAELTWIVAGQTLTSGTFLLFFGRMADLFGRRRQIVCGMGIFSLLLLISGFARDPIFLNVFLALSGVACAAVVPAAVGKLGVVYDQPSRRKNRAFSCFGAGAPVGVVIGSLVGGVASVVADWRASVWVLAVLYALLTVLAWCVVPEDIDQQRHPWNLTTLKKFDVVGTVLCTVGLITFTFALTEAGVNGGGWKAPDVIACLVVGVVLLASFAWWEVIRPEPLIPKAPWRDRDFTLLLIVLCLGFYGFNCNIFWLTLLWQQVYGNSPLEVAVKFLPASLGGIVMCVVAAMIIHRMSNRIISMVAASALVASGALLSSTSPAVSYWALTFPALILSVVGQDLQFCLSNLYVVSAMPREQRSIAGGILQTMTRLSAAVGLGVQTSLYSAAGGGNEGDAAMKYRPYQVTFWASLVGAVLALVFVPFIRLGKQGHQKTSDTERQAYDAT